MGFEDNIILRIKRRFTHDEEIGLLLKALSDTKFRLGELESENAELKHELAKPKEGKTAKEWKRDDFFTELKMQLTKTMEAKRDANKTLEMWRNKYFSLIAKVMQGAPHLLNTSPSSKTEGDAAGE